MNRKQVILERAKNGRTHRSVLTKACCLHSDIVESLHQRLMRWKVPIEIGALFAQVVEKR